MEVRPPARSHGIDDADIAHAWTKAIRLVEYTYHGEDRLLVIGPDRHGMRSPTNARRLPDAMERLESGSGQAHDLLADD